MLIYIKWTYSKKTLKEQSKSLEKASAVLKNFYFCGERAWVKTFLYFFTLEKILHSKPWMSMFYLVASSLLWLIVFTLFGHGFMKIKIKNQASTFCTSGLNREK